MNASEAEGNDRTAPRYSFQTRMSRRNLLGVASALGGMVFAGAVPAPSAAAVWDIPVYPAATYDASVALAWFELTLDLIRTTQGFSPPVASRAFGYLGVTLYEALVPGMPEYQSLAGLLAGLIRLPLPADPWYHWPTVANSALASMTRSLFSTTSLENQAAIDTLERSFAQQFASQIPPWLHARSIERGKRIASHIFAWSRNDGGHEGERRNFPADYVPPVGPGLWSPTPPGFSPALQPFWGENRTFMIGNPEALDPGPPPPFSTDPSSRFFAEAFEVYQTVNQLSAEQLEIARFWSDDAGATASPPGHSISILNQVLAREGAGLALAAEAFAKVGMALADAFVCCWNTKYRYNLIRPISYIQQYIDSAWGNPLPLITPPFPEYTSGHSVQSAAAATVMTRLFGPLAFVDHTHDARGLPSRSFTSFAAAAEEAAISRLYGGIHYRMSIENGLAQGQRIGQQVAALPIQSCSVNLGHD